MTPLDSRSIRGEPHDSPQPAGAIVEGRGSALLALLLLGFLACTDMGGSPAEPEREGAAIDPVVAAALDRVGGILADPVLTGLLADLQDATLAASLRSAVHIVATETEGTNQAAAASALTAAREVAAEAAMMSRLSDNDRLVVAFVGYVLERAQEVLEQQTRDR